MKLTHFGKIVNGVKVYNNPKLRDMDIKEMEGCEFEETTEKRKKKRTNPMNRYYRGVVVPLVWRAFRDLGHEIRSADHMHEILKGMFNKKRLINEDTGELIAEYGGSTTEMGISDMQDYWADIAQWSAENLGLEIPEPREVMGDEFVKMDRKELKKTA